MEYAIAIGLSLVLIMSFIVMSKQKHIFEIVFEILISEFIISSYFALLVTNYEVWTVSEQPGLFFMFKIYEVLFIPIVYLFYFHFYASFSSFLSKAFMSFGLIVLLCISEIPLIQWEAIDYRNWEWWKSGVGYISILLSISILNLLFSSILKGEGVNMK